MATHIKDIRCGNRTYYISYSGRDVYYSTSGRGKGTTRLKKATLRNNEISIDGRGATDVQICLAIRNN